MHEPVATLGDHYWIDDEVRKGEGACLLGHDVDDRGAAQHAGLHGVRDDVGEDRIDLRGDELRRHLVDANHGYGVLRCERGESRHAVNAESGECLEVGLDAGAAAGVRARNREDGWRHAA